MQPPQPAGFGPQHYTLYLDPKSQKFHFISGELEFSFAYFQLMGTGEQLLELSIMKPWPGENKLPDRLLANPEIAARYRKLLEELTATVFTKERLLSEFVAIDKATEAIRGREQQAAAARRGPAAPVAPPDLSRLTSRPLPRNARNPWQPNSRAPAKVSFRSRPTSHRLNRRPTGTRSTATRTPRRLTKRPSARASRRPGHLSAIV